MARARGVVESTRPNIRESHSEIRTRVPFCIAETCAARASYPMRTVRTCAHAATCAARASGATSRAGPRSPRRSTCAHPLRTHKHTRSPQGGRVTHCAPRDPLCAANQHLRTQCRTDCSTTSACSTKLDQNECARAYARRWRNRLLRKQKEERRKLKVQAKARAIPAKSSSRSRSPSPPRPVV